MKAYNQKIIETPTYLEIYDYEAIITPKQKADKNENNPKQKIELDWLYEEENPTTDKRKKYDKLSAQGQHDSLKRKQKYYQNMRFEIARLVDMNFEKSALSVKQTLATCDKWEIKFQVSKAKKSLNNLDRL